MELMAANWREDKDRLLQEKNTTEAADERQAQIA